MSKDLLYAPSAEALELAQALGLPRETTAFSLSVRTGSAAVLEVETFVQAGSAPKLAKVVKRYHLSQAKPTEPLAELLHWHSVADTLPDADITVLMWTRSQDGVHDWCSGWWDGERWHDCSGWPVENEGHFTVTHWAQPEGPQQ